MLSILTFILYPLAIQYEVRKWPIKWLYYFTGILDVFANYTELVILTLDSPEDGEWTFSKRLKRLQYGTKWQRFISSVIIPYLNYFQPGHVPK